ncbi:MAG: PadR family transcriptional regulator [Sphingomonadaceae bacterium]
MKRMGGKRRQRMFEPGLLQILLLSLIAKEQRHGYELIREIESLTHGSYAPSPGVVYPALTYMEEAGWLTASQDANSRKIYTITDAGRTHLEENAEAAQAAHDRLERIARRHKREEANPVRQAMHALKAAIADKLGDDAGGGDAGAAQAVADAIDTATQSIRKL